MGISDAAKSSSADMAAMSDLETELALLREENAQLKVERHRPADTGHVIERMRSLRLHNSFEALAGSSAQPREGAIAESLAIREGLSDACREVQQAMQGIRAKLGSLAGDIHSRVEDQAKSAQRVTSPVETVAEETMAESSAELTRSVA
jgi:hypothetical protein